MVCLSPACNHFGAFFSGFSKMAIKTHQIARIIFVFFFFGKTTKNTHAVTMKMYKYLEMGVDATC